MLNIIEENFAFIIISVSVILILIIAYFMIIKPKRYDVKNKDESLKVSFKDKKDKKILENDIVDDTYEEETSHEEKKQPVSNFKTEHATDESVLHDDQAKIKESMSADDVMEDAKHDQEKKKTEKEDKPDLGKYHILYREKDDMWYVKREGSDKTIRVLHTKKEAVAYATIKAINQDTNIVVHGKDGKIEKHGY